jgi:hypothetical protein
MPQNKPEKFRQTTLFNVQPFTSSSSTRQIANAPSPSKKYRKTKMTRVESPSSWDEIGEIKFASRETAISVSSGDEDGPSFSKVTRKRNSKRLVSESDAEKSSPKAVFVPTLDDGDVEDSVPRKRRRLRRRFSPDVVADSSDEDVDRLKDEVDQERMVIPSVSCIQ